MCRTPASILPSAALGPLRTWRGLCFASFKRCAGSSVVRTYLSPVGRAPTLCASVASSVLGASASIKGSELPRHPRYGAPALRFAPPRCPKPLSGPTPRSLRTIPDDEGVRMSGWPPHRGGAQPSFGCGRLHNYYQRRIKRILRTSPFGPSRKLNFALTEFPELRKESCINTAIG
jgi:hypothetical protein